MNKSKQIAIIGLSGRYPRSNTINELWENLLKGNDCIEQIPKIRWDYRSYYDPVRGKKGKIYCKWGGFLNGDIYEFDPLFFNISPREAEYMGPHERLFLQEAWKTFEDAGYCPEQLDGHNKKIGVFVGISWGELNYTVANRVSYLFNFKGPSLSIDTACASSLNAIHLAKKSIQDGECEIAIAGGVNLKSEARQYIMSCHFQSLSPSGRCHAFGVDADGYVPAEGVGCVLLKPLDKAIADGDHIYGIIKGSGVSHGGKTNGYTVPNVNAQSEAIFTAIQEAQIDPRSITYIEAHGTGTVLGDPIEVRGLTKVFQNFTRENNFCALGSIKSNIGHCEAAAGIAGLTKALLQIQHRKIVASLHSNQLNPKIDFLDSPFFVPQKITEWTSPVAAGNGKRAEAPRIVGISSYGAGGTNTHIIVEEYIPPLLEEGQTQSIIIDKNAVYMIPVSAKTSEQLRVYIQQLSDFIEQRIHNFSEEIKIDSFAYTLQIGRHAMEFRTAFVVQDLNELKHKLKAYLNGDKEGIVGSVRNDLDILRGTTSIDEMNLLIKALIQKGRIEKIAQLWVIGHNIDWNLLYFGKKPKKIGLPAYPFAREYYPYNRQIDLLDITQTGVHHTIHPMLHQNISTFYEVRFKTTFTGEEYFIKDHVVKGMKIIPAVVFLEMARAAMLNGFGVEVDQPQAIILKNIMWMRPVVIYEKEVQVYIILSLNDENQILFNICSQTMNNGSMTEHCQGAAEICSEAQIHSVKISEAREKCNSGLLTSQQCYNLFSSIDVEFGLGYQGIEEIYVGDDCAVARICIPESVLEISDQFVIHPSIVDAALQTTITMTMDKNGETADLAKPKLYIPFALDEIKILGPCTTKMFAVVKRTSHSFNNQESILKSDIDICDENGSILIRLSGLSSRFINENSMLHNDLEKTITYLHPVWKPYKIIEPHKNREFEKHLAVFCGLGDIDLELIEKQLSKVQCITIDSIESNIAERFEMYAFRVLEELQQIIKYKIKPTVLIQIIVKSSGDQQVFRGLSGLLKTAYLENPLLVGQIIEMEDTGTEKVLQSIQAGTNSLEHNHLKFQEEGCFIFDWQEIEDAHLNYQVPWCDGGVYLITGGTGGLGMKFAQDIVNKVSGGVVILTGRSELSSEKKNFIKTLSADSFRIEYCVVDSTDEDAVFNNIKHILNTYGKLNGIIHCAGVIKDSYLYNKTKSEFQDVLLPKVKGLYFIDQATKHVNLDFFVCFSSLAGAVGNSGQADYATANAFMDAFAQYRASLVASGLRYGNTLSINWAGWKDVGMQVEDKLVQLMEKRTGLQTITPDQGIRAFYACLSSGVTQMLVVGGEIDIIRDKLLGKIELKSPLAPIIENKETSQLQSDESVDENLQNFTENYFKEIVSRVLKLPSHRIALDAPLEKYGIDSILIMELNTELEEVFGSLSKTLFFEYQNISALSAYFMEFYSEKLHSIMSGDNKKTHVVDHVSKSRLLSNYRIHHNQRNENHKLQVTVDDGKKDRSEIDIAIIGLSGRYPKARNVDEFWENLKSGLDCITEIPKSRWNHDLFFNPQKNTPGKAYSKWGGFLDGVDEFDPLFFNISPREAQLMDPQERLCLESVYEALEDAGYTKDELQRKHHAFGLGGNVGVFLGVMYEEYILAAAQQALKGKSSAVAGSLASIANRISYFFDFHGPSMAIDSMCSSSLTAIHLACESIKSGECEVALAGGVNISIHPNKYLMLSQGMFASSNGRCQTFGDGGDGYVPGEGVGIILLKPLDRAKNDGDHIYGIIKSTFVNHGGKTNSYTVPNPNAQASVITQALRRAGIDDARKVSYVEAHGTGTVLGDPIEITGLSKAFSTNTQEKQFCAIGSVKSNIGHCEGAAGIAGVTKVLLQLKHKEIVPSLHSTVTNPNINFEMTPFFVQQERSDWKRPVLQTSTDGVVQWPRIAGVSAFGAGGSNSHVIIQEYIQEKNLQKISGIKTQEKLIFVFSAKDKQQLDELIMRYVVAINEKKINEENLIDVSYTLQVGREVFNERLALLAESSQELKQKLDEVLNGKIDGSGVFRSQAKQNSGILDIFAHDDDLQKTIHTFIQKKKFYKLLELWVNGLNVDWEKLYDNFKPGRISLPTYPFAKQRYWIGNSESFLDEPDGVSSVMLIHPLVHHNTSDLNGLRFSSEFTGDEWFLSDHRVNGKPVLPAVVYLEMIRTALEKVSGSIEEKPLLCLTDVFWPQFLSVSESKILVNVGLQTENGETIGFEIYSLSPDTNDEVIHSQGVADYTIGKESKKINIEQILLKSVKQLERNECYQYFESLGGGYGQTFQAIKTIYILEETVLAKLSLNEEGRQGFEEYFLHPGIMDSAIQASIGLFYTSREGDNSASVLPTEIFVPFSLDKLVVYDSCKPEMWAFVRPVKKIDTPNNSIIKIDIDICNLDGVVCVQMCGLMLKKLADHSSNSISIDLSNQRVEEEKEIKQNNTLETPNSIHKIKEKVAFFLKEKMSEILKLPINKIDSTEPLENYGFDSILVIQLLNELRNLYPELESSLLFEYRTIDELSGYLAEVKKETTIAVFGKEKNDGQYTQKESVPKVNEKIQSLRNKKNEFPRLFKPRAVMDVAIIGVAGKYAGSENLDEFWDNLKKGKNCITEIPPDRWDWREFSPEKKGGNEAIYTKWGGFIKDVDSFDPLFFQISPADAENIDPQERLVLQTVYSCIEDSGYTPATISSSKRIGVYIGVMNSTYNRQASHWSIANRVSYFYDFQGPSMAIDTACSSSLTAIHLALESIYNGSSEIALAGGVNIIVGPYHYQGLSVMRMLSSGRDCKAFADDADGFVDGEGVGVIILKPLAKAISDRDNIYAVIKGSALNSGGRTNGYTVPNPKAQSDVISEVLKKTGIHADQISYVEAHGTGTALGDPIEISGLSKSFELHTAKKQYCPIGSVKTNIGHCESAAGIAGLTKILLQLKYKMLVPSLHSRALNKNINFQNTPFYVQQKCEQWKSPYIEIAGTTKEIPRIAGLSSFGAGGANAHVILQEFMESDTTVRLDSYNLSSEVIIVLSAKNEDRLKANMYEMCKWIDRQEFTQNMLQDMAFTLQIGRQAFEERFAMVVDSIDMCRTGMTAFLNGARDNAAFYYNRVKKSGDDVTEINNDHMACLDQWYSQKKLDNIAGLWVKGAKVDWLKLYTEETPHRISIPGYMFSKKKYWKPAVFQTPINSDGIKKQDLLFDQEKLGEVLDELIDNRLDLETAFNIIEKECINDNK